MAEVISWRSIVGPSGCPLITGGGGPLLRVLVISTLNPFPPLALDGKKGTYAFGLSTLLVWVFLSVLNLSEFHAELRELHVNCKGFYIRNHCFVCEIDCQ